MHFQFNRKVVKVSVVMGLLFALTGQQARAQCGSRPSSGGQQYPPTQQYGLQQQYALQQQYLQQQYAFQMQQYAMQQQQQQQALQQQSSTQSAMQQTPNSPPSKDNVALVREVEFYIPPMRSETADSDPPVDAAVINARDAKLRLSAIKTLVSTGKPEVALRFADQLVSKHPNSPQAAEAKTIIKTLAKDN